VKEVRTTPDGKSKFCVTFPAEGFESQYLLPVVAATATNLEVGKIGQVVQMFGGTYAGQFGITMKAGETAAKWQVELQGGELVYVDLHHVHVVDTTQVADQENSGWVTGQAIINPPQRPYYNNYKVDLGDLPAWLDEYQNDPAAPVELVVVDNRKGVAVHQCGLTSLGDATNRICQAPNSNTPGAGQPGPSNVVGTASSTPSGTSDAAEVSAGSAAAAVAADSDREWTLKFGFRRGHARYGREVSAMKSVDCMFSLVVKHAAGSQHVLISERCWHTHHDVSDPSQANFLKPTEAGIQQCWAMIAAGVKPKMICDVLNQQIEAHAGSTPGPQCPNRLAKFIESFNDPKQQWTIGMVVAQQKAYKRTQLADHLPDTAQVSSAKLQHCSVLLYIFMHADIAYKRLLIRDHAYAAANAVGTSAASAKVLPYHA
jgi:hypothetical protein